MDVVRTVLDRLKGTVHVISQPGKGTTIQLRAPLTLASIQTLLFRVGGRLFAVPISSVVEITRVSRLRKFITSTNAKFSACAIRCSRWFASDSLKGIHAVDPHKSCAKKHFVIVIGAAEKRFGLVVDQLVGEEELVIKALPADIVASDLVSGASILGDGTVVLILNVPAVLSRLSRAIPLGAIA